MTTYKDKNGYKRKDDNSNLWHRKIAYYKIYLKDRKKYPLPFSEYEIHHIDGDKDNNSIENLAILTPEEHIDVHLEIDKLLKESNLGLMNFDEFLDEHRNTSKTLGELDTEYRFYKLQFPVERRKEIYLGVYEEYFFNKEIKKIKESGNREQLVDFLLTQNKISHSPEHSKLIAESCDKDFFNKLIDYYLETGEEIRTNELNEILSNKEEFLKMMSPNEIFKRKIQKQNEGASQRINQKIKAIQTQKEMNKISNKILKFFKGGK